MKPNVEKKVNEKIEKMEEFSELWETYEQILSEDGYYDFDDQINWVVNELQANKDLRFDLQEQYQWILVDEYQDTNGSQNDILWALTEGVEDPNLFVVGDDDQSIYRFQGASLANILDFKNHFPSAKTIILTRNYRSPQMILDAAYKVIEKNIERADPNKSLKSEISKDALITQTEFLSSFNEVKHIVNCINQKLKEGFQPNEISILVRKNSEIENLARELPRFGINVSTQVAQDIFKNFSVKILILMLKVFGDINNNRELLELMYAPHLKIPREELIQLSIESTKENIIILEMLSRKVKSDQSSFKDFYNFFINTRSDYFHLRPPALAEKLFYESGLAKHISEEKNYLDAHHVRKFIDWVREQNTSSTSEIIQKN